MEEEINKYINKLAEKFKNGNYKEVEEESNILKSKIKDEPFFSNIYALSLSLQGKKDDAIKVFQDNISKFPNYVLSYFNLGKIFYENNDYSRSIVYLNQAIEVQPDFADSYGYLSEIYISKEQFKDAESINLKCIEKSPDKAVGFLGLGKTKFFDKDYTESINFIDKALKIEDNNFYALMIKGVCCHSLGKYEEAITAYKKSININPKFPDALNNYGVTLSKVGRSEEAIEAFKKSISFNNQFPEAYRNLAKEYALTENPKINFNLNYEKFDKALVIVNKALELKPNYVDALRTKSLILLKLNNYNEAINVQEKLIELSSNNEVDYTNLGVLYQNLGKIDQAKKCFDKAIEINPLYTPSSRYISRIKSYNKKDEHISLMEELLSSSKLELEMKIDLYFALFKAYDDIGNHDKALKYLNLGNTAADKVNKYNPDITLNINKQTIKTFNKKYINSIRDPGLKSSDLIFIIGMPRSGTTLVEQILSSHSQIQGGGELDFFENSMRKNFGDMNMIDIIKSFPNKGGNIFSDIGKEYLEKINKIRKNNNYITDKMPMNFKYVGIINLTFPDAKIIHCLRDPLDTCLSNYKNLFNASSMGYTNNVRNLVNYFKSYREIMNHWGKVINKDMHNIYYEDLINDQKRSTEILLKYCNVRWEEGCIDFYKTKRVVDTASSYQVRQKVNDKSIGLWKKYDDLFNEYKDELLNI
tara:strand:- start:7552 stop:9657 length:2106 start_codon:yes stop_codon:yes gene_type:complete